MIKLTHIVTLTTALAIGLSGVVLAAEGDRGERGNRNRGDVERPARDRNRESRVDRSPQSRPNREQGASAGRFADRVDRRQGNQRARIRDGRESGNLTRRENRKLRRDQKKISRMQRRFERDGVINKRERRRLNKAQDRASRRISRFKHNDRVRGYQGGRGWGSRRDYGHSRKMRERWNHGRQSYIFVNPTVEQVAYEPSGSSSLALDLQFDGFNVGWSKTEQF